MERFFITFFVTRGVVFEEGENIRVSRSDFNTNLMGRADRGNDIYTVMGAIQSIKCTKSGHIVKKWEC